MSDKPSFPDLSSKLTAPTKKSVFERQKAEAEAKRAREKAETAAVYEDFVKSFDDEGTSAHGRDKTGGSLGGAGASGNGLAFGGSGGGGPGKRHFTGSNFRSGPGSLGPSPAAPRSGPGSLTPQQQLSFGRKRTYEETQTSRRDREKSHGMFAYEDDKPLPPISVPADGVAAFRTEDDEDDKGSTEVKAAAKPTLHLSSLPPGTSPALVKSIIPSSLLTVENIRILPPTGPSGPNSSSTDRRATSAIVTLAPDTAATDIDTVVSQLQNKYLGFGFNLNISRYLSSAALGNSGAVLSATAGLTSLTNLPFGARPLPQQTSLSRAPPPGSRGGFAPPTSYVSSSTYGASGGRGQRTQVTVQPPSDLKQLKLIHKTLEALLTYGPEFEALLMSRPTIQQDEKWAWLYNPRCAGGVYYRWRLWDILTDSSNRRRDRRGKAGHHGRNYGLQDTSEQVFENSPSWVVPEQNLRFEYTTRMDEFIADPDYDSSDEEEDDYHTRRHNDHNLAGVQPLEGPADFNSTNDGVGYLNPLSKAKLVHLLSRLPNSNAKLRKGDVARVTAFAIEHAGSGADEVVEIITANVLKPLMYTSANPEKAIEREEEDGNGDADGMKERIDQSSASLVGLYVVSDILSSSSTSGVRHAWRYRSLFETVLKARKVFETLGKLDKELGWGRLKAEKWKRSVQSIMSLWEGWCVFPQSSQEEFVQNFLNPPLTDKEKATSEKEESQKRTNEEREARKATTSKWRSVEDGAEEEGVGGVARSLKERDDDAMQDADGNDEEEEFGDEDLDGEAMDEDPDDFNANDLDGEPMVGSSDEEAAAAHRPAEENSPRASNLQQPTTTTPTSTTAAMMRKQRPKAVDMFADEDEDEDHEAGR